METRLASLCLYTSGKLQIAVDTTLSLLKFHISLRTEIVTGFLSVSIVVMPVLQVGCCIVDCANVCWIQQVNLWHADLSRRPGGLPRGLSSRPIVDAHSLKIIQDISALTYPEIGTILIPILKLDWTRKLDSHLGLTTYLFTSASMCALYRLGKKSNWHISSLSHQLLLYRSSQS